MLTYLHYMKSLKSAREVEALRATEEGRRGETFPPVTSDQLLAAADRLATVYPPIQAVYLFGSRARGRVRPGSDVDLAVWMDPLPEDRITMEAELARLAESLLFISTDVVILTRETPLPLLFEIFSLETVLFARDYVEAHDLACRCRAAYRDNKPRLDHQLSRALKFMEELSCAPNPS